MRLRTLPLAISGILMGSSLAELNGYETNKYITLLALLTATALQILSNLANDYGDFIKGTDNEKRIGNMRTLQSGKITAKDMLKMIVFFVALCLVTGCSLLYVSINNFSVRFLLFFILGIAAIAAAIKYTIGKRAYGYSGFGDVFVFIFFGPVAVLGSYILQHQAHFNWQTDKVILLPAIAIGLLSTAVLNTNNIRDIDNDRNSGKNTIVVKMGLSNAKKYHWILIIMACACITVFVILKQLHWLQYLCLLALYPIIKQAARVQKTKPNVAYNALLKQLSLAILFFVVVFIVLQTIAIGIFAYNAIQQLM